MPCSHPLHSRNLSLSSFFSSDRLQTPPHTTPHFLHLPPHCIPSIMSREMNAADSAATDASVRRPTDRKLPGGWQCHISTSKGLPYYYNAALRYSMWEFPPEVMRARHLLVKHNRSRNPVNHRGEQITRSKEQAVDILSQYQEIINSQTTPQDKEKSMIELSKNHSDCRSAERGGDLCVCSPCLCCLSVCVAIGKGEGR